MKTKFGVFPLSALLVSSYAFGGGLAAPVPVGTTIDVSSKDASVTNLADGVSNDFRQFSKGETCRLGASMTTFDATGTPVTRSFAGSSPAEIIVAQYNQDNTALIDFKRLKAAFGNSCPSGRFRITNEELAKLLPKGKDSIGVASADEAAQGKAEAKPDPKPNDVGGNHSPDQKASVGTPSSSPVTSGRRRQVGPIDLKGQTVSVIPAASDGRPLSRATCTISQPAGAQSPVQIVQTLSDGSALISYRTDRAPQGGNCGSGTYLIKKEDLARVTSPSPGNYNGIVLQTAQANAGVGETTTPGEGDPRQAGELLSKDSTFPSDGMSGGGFSAGMGTARTGRAAE